MTFLTLVYLGTLLIFFMWIFKYTLIEMFQITVLSLCSFSIFLYISDNYKFSNNKYIFWLQKFVYYSLIFALIVLVGWLLYLVGVNLNILGSIYCDSDDEDDDGESSTNNKKNT